MKLVAAERSKAKKSETKQIRRDGKIPVNFYAKGRPNLELAISAQEFSAILRQLKPGQLPTTVFSVEVEGNLKRAIIKDIQYKLTTYQVSHIDFEELVDDVPVSVKVPIRCVGVADCAGVKLGGYLRQVNRHVLVECLPGHIPAEFVVDVTDLGIKQSKRLADITMPKGVRPLAKMDEVVVVIAKRAG